MYTFTGWQQTYIKRFYTCTSITDAYYTEVRTRKLFYFNAGGWLSSIPIIQIVCYKRKQKHRNVLRVTFYTLHLYMYVSCMLL